MISSEMSKLAETWDTSSRSSMCVTSFISVVLLSTPGEGQEPATRADLYDAATELLLGWDTRWRRTLAAPPAWLDAIKPAGKRLMSWQDFVNGRRVKPGDCFEELGSEDPR